MRALHRPWSLRTARRLAGLCLDCGGPRIYPTLRCRFCLLGLLIRVERSRFRLREGLR